MKTLNKITTIAIIAISSLTITTATNSGPVLAEKLEAPVEVKQTLQKRALTWIEGQWSIENNQYVWTVGHWEVKRAGYVFISGEWNKTSKGWTWTEGYWKQIDMHKWMNLYA